MDIETKAFQELIKSAHHAHKIYNAKGAQAAIHALAGLNEMTLAIIGHIKSENNDRLNN